LKFAHLADTHLGRQKDEKLRIIEKQIFKKTVDTILKNNVEFVLIAGDFFDVNIPDMETQKFTFEQFKKFKNKTYQFMLFMEVMISHQTQQL
tara:strand:- start:143 stop:418 length:276 start_codon:yes stop_codon:yes gene_type:complete